MSTTLTELVKLIKGNGRPGLYEVVLEHDQKLKTIDDDLRCMDEKVSKHCRDAEIEQAKKSERSEAKVEKIVDRNWDLAIKIILIIVGAVVGQIINTILFKGG